MKGICKIALMGALLCLGLLWPAAAQGAPPELYRFPQLEEGVLGGQLFIPTGIAVNPEPPPPPPGCEGEACRGAGSAPNSGPGPATGTFSGPGNQPRLHCPKGKIARKGHCVNRKTKKHHRRGKHQRTVKRAGGNR
jgi:hypothetical protein